MAVAAAVLSLHSTSYCDRHALMADGSFTRPRSVAMNSLPFGSKIKLLNKGGFFGLHIFYVRDRYAYGTELDFWSDNCGKSKRWGARKARIRVLRRGK